MISQEIAGVAFWDEKHQLFSWAVPFCDVHQDTAAQRQLQLRFSFITAAQQRLGQFSGPQNQHRVQLRSQAEAD